MRNPISVDTTKPYIVIETFDNALVGSYETEPEAIKAAQADNKSAPGDALYVIGQTIGTVSLSQFTPAAKPVPVASSEEALAAAQKPKAAK
mgnify:CR=1 FL=1